MMVVSNYFRYIVLLVAMFFLTACYRHVNSYSEIQGGAVVGSKNYDESKLILNIDSDAVNQYESLSKSEKVKYVLKWGEITFSFKQKTGIDSLYNYEKVTIINGEIKNALNPERVVFIFPNGEKFTVTIGAARGNKYHWSE